MCILVLSTKHPKYPLILLSNRDEFFVRDTRDADWWDNNQEIFAPQDLAKDAKGTWIGVSRTGKISVILNIREDASHDERAPPARCSRGDLPPRYLASGLQPKSFIDQLLRETPYDSLKNDYGGFTLVCGDIKTKQFYELRNQRTDPSVPAVVKIDQPVFAVSNALPGEQEWPKVNMAQQALSRMIDDAIENDWSEEEIVSHAFDLISKDTMPQNLNTPHQKLMHLKNTIFVPPLQTVVPSLTDIAVDSLHGVFYGTRTQTVIIADSQGQVRYCERTLHNKDSLENTDRLPKITAFSIL
ncbi:hypothetical protein CANCADRAFT_1005 [Tortispora caseinolytica NRRL Y-17796]|uniref:Transport and Golgi organization protein 2 n=1 Tax=Tortispora caseinolytica NRRL Y-17796 TaxID=767744 RepID=A0A1E4TKY1_9ASCO|nr:hypothetical protein CANCADRAFT_1005 [Tortispora caseinolytica NRRL Y-17796]